MGSAIRRPRRGAKGRDRPRVGCVKGAVEQQCQGVLSSGRWYKDKLAAKRGCRCYRASDGATFIMDQPGLHSPPTPTANSKTPTKSKGAAERGNTLSGSPQDSPPKFGDQLQRHGSRTPRCRTSSAEAKHPQVVWKHPQSPKTPKDPLDNKLTHSINSRTCGLAEHSITHLGRRCRN